MIRPFPRPPSFVNTALLLFLRLLCYGPSLFVGTISFGAAHTLPRSRRSFVSSLAVAGTTMSSPSSSVVAEGRFVRWGIVGVGDVCRVKSGPPFWKCEGSRLVAVTRRTPGAAAAFAAGVPPTPDDDGGRCVGYDDLDDFLNHPGGLDAVYVCTPPGAHLEVCERIAAASAAGSTMAVYVEKPVGRCAAETERIVEACPRLYTAYISRGYEKTSAIRDLIREGAIGDRVASVSYRAAGSVGARGMDGDDSLPWRLDAARSGGGLIMDVGCHVLDRLDFLCEGPLERVAGRAENRGRSAPNVDVEDFVTLEAVVGGTGPHRGARVTCEWNFACDDPDDECDELVLVGSAGASIRTAGGPTDPVRLYRKGKSTPWRVIEFDPIEHTGRALIQAVTDDLLGKRTADFLSYGDNAVRAQKVIDAALESYYGGREIGFWNRPDTWPGSPRNKSKEGSKGST